MDRIFRRRRPVAVTSLFFGDNRSNIEQMEAQPHFQRRRGRPPRQREALIDTRELLLRAGLEVLTEKGFSATGIEEILGRVSVPKGSFYHYFDSKEAFGLDLIERYGEFFARKLDRHLGDQALSPLKRVRAFIDDAKAGMARHQYRRGCLIGNLGQEMGALPESFRARLKDTFKDWQSRFSACLAEAQKAGELARDADTKQLAAFFWIGWEGAVLRAKLEQTAKPLELFARLFIASLPRG
jgi:TetR/AcrR family transcriptional repressor of nem operon